MSLLYPKKIKLKLFIFATLLLVAGGLFYTLKSAQAYVGNDGTMAFGEGTTTSTSCTNSRIGCLTGNSYTFSSNSFGTKRRKTFANNSPLQFVVNRAGVTRPENMIADQRTNGSLYVSTCAAGCPSAPVAQWNTTILGSSVTTRAFDVAYEQLSGRAMVVYAGNTTGKLYYCYYDGSTWGPQSNCAPTAGVNEISLTDGTRTLSGTPSWVKLMPQGSQFSDPRSNQILMAVQDTNRNLFVTKWTGTAWTTTDRLVVNTAGTADTIGSTTAASAFDVGWESLSGTEMVMYANGTSLTYRTSSGAGWSATSTITALSSAGTWVKLSSDPQSNRMSLITAFGTTATPTVRPYIWKTNGTTAGWTAGTDLAAAQDNGENLSTAWEKANSVSGTPTAKAMFVSTASGLRVTSWSAWTVAGGFTAWTALGTNSSDILINNEVTASPNSDIMMNATGDRDGSLRARSFDGNAWGSLLSTNLSSTSLQNTTTGHLSNTSYVQKSYQFAYKPYSAWSYNWRVYDDESTAGNPGQALAAEGVTPSVKPLNTVRLRMSYIEQGGSSQTDTRKRLQFSSGAGCPDSSSCVWTDVAAQAATTAAWRYADGGLTDDAQIPSTVLDDSSALGTVVENGTSSSTNGDHSGGTVAEYDYTLQNYSGVIGTTYYFRGYDFGKSTTVGSPTDTSLNAIYREQILNTSGTESTPCTTNGAPSACTYPSMLAYTSAPHPPTFYRPVDGDIKISTAPTIQLKSSDDENDYVQYVIEWCPTNSWPCPANGGSFDQTASQSGWSGQDANSSTAYVGNFVEANSTMGLYSVSPGVFRPNTTYYLRAKAIDPGGSNTYSLTYSSTISFTTATLEVRILGGTCIGGTGGASTDVPASTCQNGTYNNGGVQKFSGNIKIGN